MFVSVKDSDKPVILPGVRKLIALGFEVVATGGTHAFLSEAGLEVGLANKVAQGRPHIVDAIVDGEIALILNTTEGWQSLKDSQSIRRGALDRKLPYYTTASAGLAAVEAIEALGSQELEVRALQDYYSSND